MAVPLPDHMQNDVVVFCVLMMAVVLPLAGFNVNLDVTADDAAVYPDDRVFEITAEVAGPTRENYMEPFAGVSHRISHRTALPQARNQLFGNFYFQLLYTFTCRAG